MGEISKDEEAVRQSVVSLAALVDTAEEYRTAFKDLMTAEEHSAWSNAGDLADYRGTQWNMLVLLNETQIAVAKQIIAFRDGVIRDARKLDDLDESIQADLQRLVARIQSENQYAAQYNFAEPTVEPGKAQAAAPTPSPTPTPSPSPSPTPSPTSTPTPSPTATPGSGSTPGGVN